VLVMSSGSAIIMRGLLRLDAFHRAMRVPYGRSTGSPRENRHRNGHGRPPVN
jgi:hypothetical protein